MISRRRNPNGQLASAIFAIAALALTFDAALLVAAPPKSAVSAPASSPARRQGPAKTDPMLANRYMDEIQDDIYARTPLHGDDAVEAESMLPMIPLGAKTVEAGLPETRQAAPLRQCLSGEWRMKDAEARGKGDAGVKAGWQKPGADRSDWISVQVPTTVQRALIESGRLPDPFWNANTYDELQDKGEPKDKPWHLRRTRVEQRDWWFVREFSLGPEWRGKRVRLRFDGIDYSGSFYLNGSPLGAYAGMFGGPEYDVSGLVKFDAPNTIAVRIDRAADTWSGILKGSPGFGWHYGHLISMGIWKDVWIETVPSVEIESPFVKTLSAGVDRAELAIEFYIQNHDAEPARIEVTGVLKGENIDAPSRAFMASLKAPHGRTRYETKLSVRNPRLWHPMGWGDQSLYRLRLTAHRAPGDSPESADARETVFGIRTLEMRPMPGATEGRSYRWQFVVNGQPMFIKGANWCWTEPMLDRDPKRYDHFLELARRGGIQMFRAWGGGIVETDEFYRLCDEKGLLVYQEFPYCWGPPDFPITDPVTLDRQVSRVVKRLRNHPSLLMYGGGNENLDIPGADEALTLVGRRSRHFDPTRPYHRTDPWGGSVHNWTVFHNGLPIDSGYRAMPSVFYGEYGLPSMPGLESSSKFLTSSTLERWPPTPDDHGVIMHLNQFHLRDLIKVLRYADYGPVRDWKSYMEYSQMAQGDALRYAADMQRAGSHDNKSGFWFYKMTDLFPGHAWSVVDFYGAPKLSYYRAKQACRPRRAFAFYEKMEIPEGEPLIADLHVANDTPASLEGARLHAVVYGSDLKAAWSKDYDVPRVKADSRIELGRIEAHLDPAISRPVLLGLRLDDTRGSLISDDWHWFNFKAKTGELREIEKLPTWTFPDDRIADAFRAYAAIPKAPLLDLPRVQLSARLESRGGNARIVIRNESDMPAFNVLIEGMPAGYGSYLEDNSFCLWPGEQRSVGVTMDWDSPPATLTVRAWNADSVSTRQE